jgi:hypothetical protein
MRPAAPMKPRELLVKCLFERDGDQWLGYCLDFTLVTQADSLPEAHRKLEEQVRSYVSDATVGEDREYAQDLLTRRAPLKYWLKFYAVLAQQALRHRTSRKRQAVCEPLPMVPATLH